MERKFKAWDKHRLVMSDPFTIFKTQLLKDGKPIGIQLSTDLIILDYLGFKDNKDRELFHGDVVKVAYQKRTSKFFEKMKENGDEFVYLFFLEKEVSFRSYYYQTHDENKYYTGCGPYGDDARFLSYLLGACKAGEIVGNVYENPELIDLIVPEKEEHHE
jgi:uncharacterized phage protein (TIGR01671 family)